MPAFSRFTFPLTLPRAPKVVGALGALWVSQALMAQAPLPETATGTAAGLKLEMSERLVEQLPGAAQSAAPSFVFGERMEGVTSERTVVEGQAELRRHDLVMRADRIEHLTATGTATATGRVRINRMGDVIEGTSLQLQLDTFVGVLEQPRFSFLSTGGQGQASRLEFQSRDRMTARNVSYTTCQRPSGNNSEPDWQISASQIEFDQTEDTGTALNSVMRFKGVPLLASPWVSFPLSDRRKSGLLPPTFNIDNRSGTELTLPYYLNLAPNRDATLYPTLMTRRGIDLGGEFRYLEPGFNGRLRAAYMPSDRLRDNERWGASVQHQHRFDGLAATGPLGLRLNLNRVSDNDYWRDFPRSSTSLTERLLPNDWVFSGGRGHWSYSAGDYRWQTLQDLDPLSQIVAPYNRVPSLAVAYQPPSFEWAGTHGWATRLLTEFTQFEKPAEALRTASDVNGARTLLVASLEKTWQTPGGYFTPGVQLHARQYRFDSPLNNERRRQLVLPTFQLDSGLFFERPTQWGGRQLLQTLEPRIFYAYTPYKDQSQLPVYDSAAFDFNLATVFTANPYGGHDRIADMNAITLGASSRLLNPDTGEEWLNVGVAQRVRLSDQRVTLPGEPLRDDRLSDLLVGGSLQWQPQWRFNGTVQFNPDTGRSVRTTLGARYHPGNYRVVSAAYRLQRGVSEQLDLGWQWPLSDLFSGPPATPVAGGGLGPNQWYSVGRMNYSMVDRRVVDLIAGFEYDAGCWIGRFVVERLQQSLSRANQRILFQLEFSGFSRLGSNPLQTLKENVPRYQYLREQINPPSRFERYD